MKITDRRFKLILAGLIMVVCLVLVSQGMNSWIQSVGLLTAGYLFGNSLK